jgi:3-hydroxyacyl-CoA dehydrogenase/enoyl-CoA hydratase/3-hydroxybutyryl-CoA epimerase
MNVSILDQFAKMLPIIEKAVNDKLIKVLIVASGKSLAFIAGADVDLLFPITDPKVIHKLAQEGQTMMNRIEDLPIPIVAAINGAALGGGLELALVCSHRVALNHPAVKLGLPEVMLGLLPGAGGTVRLPRVVGLQKALPLILGGGSLRPGKAKALKLIDEVFEGPQYFYPQVRSYAIGLIGASRRPSPTPDYSWQDWMLETNPLGRTMIQREAVKNLDSKTKGKYPAPYVALSSVLESWGQPRNPALAVEARSFTKLAVTPESKSLMSLFYMMERTKKLTNFFKVDAKSIPKVTKIGVIGAGLMGAQIALLLAKKNYKIYMRDIKSEIVEKGMQYIRSTFEPALAKKKITQEKVNLIVSRISGGTSVDGFKDCQLVIEAAVEIMDLKKKILKEIEGVVPPTTIFATNTSSLSIIELSKSSARPANVVGMHFFNPVNLMPLVEVIKGPRTSDTTAAMVYGVALKLGKIPIVCNDGPGFIVNR